MLENKNKTCTFYASDYHFEMIILPYLDKKIDENYNIIIFTENNLKDSIDILISRMNLKENKKEKILNIDWRNDDRQKFNILKNIEKGKKDTVVFIKGTENYINNINEKIKENKIKNNLKIVDCYSVDDLKNNMTTITKNYKSYLNTSGENIIN